jgi:hypothetical protein
MRRWSASCLVLLPFLVLSAQDNQTTGLKVEAVEGDGAINSIRLKHGHDPAVRVQDAAGKPIAGATVTFLLPRSGASGTFLDHGLSLTTETDSQGRAVGRGMRPNAVEGQFHIRVTASWQGSEGATTLVQTNAEPANKSSHTKLIVILAAVGGAAAAGAALAARGGHSNPATAGSTTSGGSISVGAPSIGPPH